MRLKLNIHFHVKDKQMSSSSSVQIKRKSRSVKKSLKEIPKDKNVDTKEKLSNDVKCLYDAFEYIAPLMKNFKCIWDPACGKNENNLPLRDFFEKMDVKVISTDSSMGEDNNFITTRNRKRHDIIVTIPPSNLIKEFLIRAVELKKPFAFFTSFHALESETVRSYLRKDKVNISLIFPSNNIEINKNAGMYVWIIGNISDKQQIIL